MFLKADSNLSCLRSAPKLDAFARGQIDAAILRPSLNQYLVFSQLVLVSLFQRIQKLPHQLCLTGKTVKSGWKDSNLTRLLVDSIQPVDQLLLHAGVPQEAQIQSHFSLEVSSLGTLGQRYSWLISEL